VETALCCIIAADGCDDPCRKTLPGVYRRSPAPAARPGLGWPGQHPGRPGSGARVNSHTLLAFKADVHPLMRRMHKPDSTLLLDAQDWRRVVPIEMAQADPRLSGAVLQAAFLGRAAAPEASSAGTSD
jgi:hypothetical protein